MKLTVAGTRHSVVKFTVAGTRHSVMKFTVAGTRHSVEIESKYYSCRFLPQCKPFQLVHFWHGHPQRPVWQRGTRFYPNVCEKHLHLKNKLV